MSILKEDTNQALVLLNKAKRIVCVTHRNPDGDAVGALIGMGMLLDNVCNGTNVLMFDRDPVPGTFSFLPNALHVVDGLATVDYEKCTGCTACSKACPRGLIEMVPFGQENMMTVACNSKENGSWV